MLMDFANELAEKAKAKVNEAAEAKVKEAAQGSPAEKTVPNDATPAQPPDSLVTADEVTIEEVKDAAPDENGAPSEGNEAAADANKGGKEEPKFTREGWKQVKKAEKALKQKPNILGELFTKVYVMIAWITLMLCAVMFMIALQDAINFGTREIKQRISSAVDAPMVKDTTDMNLMKYVQLTKLKDEPQQIYAGQSIVRLILWVVGVTILVIISHVTVFAVLAVKAKINHEEFTETLDIPAMHIGAVALGGFGAHVINKMYKKRFIGETQDKMKEIQSQLRDIRVSIFQSLSTNDNVLTALRNANLQDFIRHVTDLSNVECRSSVSGSCTYPEVQKAMFSYGLYRYYSENIPANSPETSKWKKLFESATVKKRGEYYNDITKKNEIIDPIAFFPYKKPVYITNYYPLLRGVGDGDINYLQPESMFVIRSNNNTDQRDQRARDTSGALNAAIQNINEKMAALFSMHQPKNKVRNYILLFMAYSAILLALMLVVLWDMVGPRLLQVSIMLWKGIKYVFSSKKTPESGGGTAAVVATTAVEKTEEATGAEATAAEVQGVAAKEEGEKPEEEQGDSPAEEAEEQGDSPAKGTEPEGEAAAVQGDVANGEGATAAEGEAGATQEEAPAAEDQNSQGQTKGGKSTKRSKVTEIKKLKRKSRRA